MSRIIVELPLDRGYCGSLCLFSESGQLLCGPFAVAGRANDQRAAAENNPSRNPLLRYGDTPTGSYRVKEIVSAPGAAASFGPHRVIVIEAMSGDAALAEANGRYRLYIQGGDSAPNGALRATAGALRLSNGDLAILLSLIAGDANTRCDVVAHEGVAQGVAVYVDKDCREEDPPALPGAANALRDLFSEVSRRDALRGAAGTAGLTALSLSVSFVSLTAATPAHAYTQMAYNEESAAPAQEPSGGAAPADNAAGQLDNATNGQQTTGQTFDNGPGPTDTTVNGNVPEPPTPTPTPVEQNPPEQNPPEQNTDTAQQPPQQPESGGEQTAAPQEGAGSGGGESAGGASGTTPNGPVYSAPPGNSTTYGPGDERTTDGGINQIQGGGQPITGAGVQQGAPDRPPPPNPTSGSSSSSYSNSYSNSSSSSYSSSTSTSTSNSSSRSSPAPSSGGGSTSGGYSSGGGGYSGGGRSYTGTSQPVVTSPGVDYSPGYSAPSSNSSSSSLPSRIVTDPRYIAARNKMLSSQAAVTKAQADLDALVAKRKAATGATERQVLDTKIVVATDALKRAKAQLLTDQANLDAVIQQLQGSK